MDDICIVTAFFDIGRGFWKDKYRRTTKFYIQSFLNYLDYPYKMVCYIDERCIDYILEHYTRSPHSNKIFIPIYPYPANVVYKLYLDDGCHDPSHNHCEQSDTMKMDLSVDLK